MRLIIKKNTELYWICLATMGFQIYIGKNNFVKNIKIAKCLIKLTSRSKNNFVWLQTHKNEWLTQKWIFKFPDFQVFQMKMKNFPWLI